MPKSYPPSIASRLNKKAEADRGCCAKLALGMALGKRSSLRFCGILDEPTSRNRKNQMARKSNGSRYPYSDESLDGRALKPFWVYFVLKGPDRETGECLHC